jgi:hypothetical protein
MTAFPHIEGMGSCTGFVLEEIKEHLSVSLAYAMITRNILMKDE